MTISVLLIERDPTFLERFRACVQGDPRLSLCGCADSVAAAVAMFDSLLPDVVLLALDLPEDAGVGFIRHAKTNHPACEVLVVTQFADDHSVTESIKAGATGYLLKDASLGDVAAAIVQIEAGGAPLGGGIPRRLLAWLRQPDSAAPAVDAHPLGPGSALLSARETEILHLVAKGLNIKQVGLVLGISPFTVATHVKRIYQKLAVHSRGEAVYEAGQMGLLQARPDAR